MSPPVIALETLSVNGRSVIPAREAARRTGWTTSYIAILCREAGKLATSSYENTLVGSQTGVNISQAAGSAFGQGETFVGYNAGNGVTTGTYNTLIGHQAGKVLTTGGSNVGVGRGSFNALTTGGYNTGVGHASGYNITTGGDNLCLGNSACSNPLTLGAGIQTGSFNAGIGEYAGATADLTNAWAIGNYTAVSSSNSLVIGSASSTYAVNVGIATSSPFAKFSIQANSADANTTLFAVASSTASATTTLMKLTNTGSLQLGAYGAGTLTTDKFRQCHRGIRRAAEKHTRQLHRGPGPTRTARSNSLQVETRDWLRRLDHLRGLLRPERAGINPRSSRPRQRRFPHPPRPPADCGRGERHQRNRLNLRYLQSEFDFVARLRLQRHRRFLRRRWSFFK
jgi:hypothetical protein